MRLTVTSTGNAGVMLANRAGTVYIDSFFHPIPDVGGRPQLSGKDTQKADLILVTHNHYDHLHPEETRDAALTSGALVAGPAKVIRVMAKYLPPEKLVELEPEERQTPPAQRQNRFGNISVTTYRTYHAQGHNSYLVEMDGVRILHDADNEHLEPYDVPALGPVDLLLLCPWAESGAGAFIQRLKPKHWLLIHMTEDEIVSHRHGAFLPGLVNPVPEGVIALRGGDALEI